jgi:hypothetical protein
MAKVHVLCLESRPIGHDWYAQGAEYDVDQDRVAKYSRVFIPVTRAKVAPKVTVEEAPAAEHGMTEDADVHGGTLVPEEKVKH